MTTEIVRPSGLEELIASSDLCKDAQARIYSQARGLTFLREAFGNLLQTNPKFHFTTAGFTFESDMPRERNRFQRQAERKGWRVQASGDRALIIDTGYVDNIRENGLRPMSCVVAMPETTESMVLLSYPRLFMESIKRTVDRFGKHAIPYKDRLLQTSNGTIRDLRVAVVLISGAVATLPKMSKERHALTNCNALKSITHFVDQGVRPEDIIDIIEIPVRQEMPCTKDGILFDNEELSGEILAGLRDKFPAILATILSSDTKGNKGAQKAAHIFKILPNSPKPNPFRQ